MKVLTIREPFATLIKDKVKIYETRSWKTNYRGEIYIHAAKIRSKASNASIASIYWYNYGLGKYGYAIYDCRYSCNMEFMLRTCMG